MNVSVVAPDLDICGKQIDNPAFYTTLWGGGIQAWIGRLFWGNGLKKWMNGRRVAQMPVLLIRYSCLQTRLHDTHANYFTTKPGISASPAFLVHLPVV
jgi:hypothetical protein